MPVGYPKANPMHTLHNTRSWLFGREIYDGEDSVIGTVLRCGRRKKDDRTSKVDDQYGFGRAEDEVEKKKYKCKTPIQSDVLPESVMYTDRNFIYTESFFKYWFRFRI